MRQNDDPRPSMLSVPARWRDLYFNAFSLLCIAGESLLIWHEIARRDEKSDYLDIIMNIVLNTGPVALAAAIFAFIVLKGRDTMLSTWETFARKRYEKGREDERKAQAKSLAEREEERKTQAKRVAELEEEREAMAKRIAEAEREDERKAQAKRIAELEEDREAMAKRIAELEEGREERG